MNKQAITSEMHNGRLTHVVAGAIRCTSLQAAIDLLEDLNKVERPVSPSPRCVVTSTPANVTVIEWASW